MTSPLDNPAFRRWFGNSKVVDARGEPLVVWHGAGATDIQAFEPGGGTALLGKGIYLSRERREADEYAVMRGGSVYPVYLRVERPLIRYEMGLGPKGHAFIKKRLSIMAGPGSEGYVAEKMAEFSRGSFLPNNIPPALLTEIFQMDGYDGVFDGRHICVFSPTQIKSAVRNSGSYDPSDPNIYKNPRGRTSRSQKMSSSRSRTSRPLTKRTSRTMRANAVRWGACAAGPFIFAEDTGRLLLMLRSWDVLEPRTWGVPGGRCEREDKDEVACAIRECREETLYQGKLRMVTESPYVYREPAFQFHNFVGFVDHEFVPVIGAANPEHGWENDGFGWFDLDSLPKPLHFGVKKLLAEAGDKVLEMAPQITKNGGLRSLLPNGPAEMWVKVKDLPKSVRAALKDPKIRFGKPDILLHVQEDMDPSTRSGYDYMCGYMAACRMDDSGTYEIAWGEYGGGDVGFYSRTDQLRGKLFDIPPGVAVVKGFVGYRRPTAEVYLHPSSMNPRLLASASSVATK